MSSAQVHQIQSLYRGLSPAEKTAVRLFINQLSGGASISSSSAPRYEQSRDWLLTGILSELARTGQRYRPFVTIGDINKTSPNYIERSTFIRSELERILKLSYPRPKYQDLLVLGDVCARALIAYCSWAPRGLQPVMNNVDKTLTALEARFPGYVNAGMLDMLIHADVR